MSGRRGRDPYRDGREEAKNRGLDRRGEEQFGSSAHSVTVCPECRCHLPDLSGFNETPAACPECTARLRCAGCGSTLVEADRTKGSDLADGLCPRCGEPADGSGTTPEDEDFTWNDSA
jgi:hypothetical protein